MDDELTPEEIAAHKTLRFLTVWPPGSTHRVIGLDVKWINRSMWRVALYFWWFGFAVTYQSFDQYCRYLLALGPYRHD